MTYCHKIYAAFVPKACLLLWDATGGSVASDAMAFCHMMGHKQGALYWQTMVCFIHWIKQPSVMHPVVYNRHMK